MPTYEYQCKACGHEFERVQRISDSPVRTCPKCRKRKVERLISQTSFVLKGGGWYNDLYSSKKKDSGKGDGDKPSSGDSKGSDGKSSDSKSGKEKGETKKSSRGDSDGGKKAKASQAAA